MDDKYDVSMPPQSHGIMPMQVTSIEQANKIINDMIRRYDENYRLLRNYVENGLLNAKIIEPIESNGAIPVNVQDQTSETIDSYFNQDLGNDFTLSADTIESGEASLSYTFTATAGHTLAPLQEILLLDVIADKVLQCVVTDVSVNTITIDRPIDHIYPSATTIGRTVSSNMAVVGSLASPQVFTFRAGADPVDITRLLLTMVGVSAMDDGKFGSIGALTNGIVLRIYNGIHKTIFNFKTNAEIKQFCYDVNYTTRTVPAGSYGLVSRISFGGQSKHGVVIRISGDDVLQWIVQDDLSAMTTVKGSVQGHKVTD